MEYGRIEIGVWEGFGVLWGYERGRGKKVFVGGGWDGNRRREGGGFGVVEWVNGVIGEVKGNGERGLLEKGGLEGIEGVGMIGERVE